VADPQTSSLGLYQPSRGSDVGTWDLPVNANAGAADSLAANVSVISLSNSTVVLSTPPNSGAAWSGPYQSQSAVLRLTGTLTSSVSVILPRAGFWIVENLCISPFVIFMGTGGGKFICPPPCEATHIYCDGTDTKFVDFGRIGSYMDLAGSSVPSWIAACSVPPYLNCDGSTFNATTYPALNGYLGGNTLPDLRGRFRAALNQGTGRITTAGSGVNGDALLSSGGAQNQTILQANFPNVNLPVTELPHVHGISPQAAQITILGGPGNVNNFAAPGASQTQPAVTGLTVRTGGSGIPLTTIPPITIGGLTLIRAG
jgi:Phage Tail Collar Domain